MERIGKVWKNYETWSREKGRNGKMKIIGKRGKKKSEKLGKKGKKGKYGRIGMKWKRNIFRKKNGRIWQLGENGKHWEKVEKMGKMEKIEK